MIPNSRKDSEESDRYLIFRLGGELFGTPLMGVREVVEYQTPKPIPNTIKSYLGVINIRGEIVGVLDLRLRFGFEASQKRDIAMMVFATDGGPLAAVSDGMEGVLAINENHIDRHPRFESNLPLTFVVGVAKVQDRLVTLIDLAQVLEAAEVTSLRSEAKSA